MRVQCDSCEKALAVVFCCADEAALCIECDRRVHSANKLASKHQRLPLLNPDRTLSCDICQDKKAHFFCLQDRALLCRNCDISIHSANNLTAKHDRFLMTSIRVGSPLCSTQEKGRSSVDAKILDSPAALFKQPSLESKPRPPSRIPTNSPAKTKPNFLSPTPTSSSLVQTDASRLIPLQSSPKGEGEVTRLGLGTMEQELELHGRNEDEVSQNECFFLNRNDPPSMIVKKPPTDEYMSGSGLIAGWRVDDLLGLPDISNGYAYEDLGAFRLSFFSDAEPSKSNSLNLGDIEWASGMNSVGNGGGEPVCQVPQMGSPPTFLGMSRSSGPATFPMKGKSREDLFCMPGFDETLCVPDLAAPPLKRNRCKEATH